MDILLVENSRTDAALAMEALNTDQAQNQVHLATGGEEALQYLFKRSGFTSVTSPELVLLDLNMPGTDGWEVLKQLRANNATSQIPVVVMTSSTYDAEYHAIRGLQADGYVVKPVKLQDVIDVVEAIQTAN